jgi:hypothetical protein
MTDDFLKNNPYSPLYCPAETTGADMKVPKQQVSEGIHLFKNNWTKSCETHSDWVIKDDDPNYHTYGAPKWFDKKNYEAAETLDALGWATQIINRIHYLIKFTDFPSDVQHTGIIPVDKEFMKESVYVQKYLGVTEILSDHNVSRNLSDYFVNLNQFNSDNYQSPVEHNIRSDFLTGRICLDLELDLRFKNSDLVKEIERLLDEKRKLFTEDVAFSPQSPNFKRWSKSGVLQFIDLEYWAFTNNVKIPDRLLLQLLISKDDRSGGATHFRATVENNAIKFLDLQMYDYLMQISKNY